MRWGGTRTWIDARSGGDEDDVAVDGGWKQPFYDKGTLQLNRRVVGCLGGGEGRGNGEKKKSV